MKGNPVTKSAGAVFSIMLLIVLFMASIGILDLIGNTLHASTSAVVDILDRVSSV